MITYGKKHCEFLKANKDGPIDPPLGATYYDSTRVFYQIADYTGDYAYWNDCAAVSQYVYRDRYSLANEGRVPGYWNFTTGHRLDYERTGNVLSKQAAILQSQNAAYAADTTPLAWTESIGLQREVAYAIVSYVNAERLGEPRRARRAQLVNQAYGHLEQLVDKARWGTAQVAPFMQGLTAEALIRDWEQTYDLRLLPVLRRVAAFLWEEAWIQSDEGMRYNLNPNSAEGLSASGAPDLNGLIAPIYSFLYTQTGEAIYRERGDALFAGGAKYAWLDGAKQFNQSYQFTFDYVKWRARTPVAMVSADLSGVRVYPNPWRSDKHAVRSITFDRLPVGSTVKLFTVSGHAIKTLAPASDTVSWDLTNNKDRHVASGLYLYLITADGQKKTGQLAIIK